MSQALNLKVLGLYTHPNVLSEAPTGALSVADNVVIRRESIAQTRRGFKQFRETGAGHDGIAEIDVGHKRSSDDTGLSASTTYSFKIEVAGSPNEIEVSFTTPGGGGSGTGGEFLFGDLCEAINTGDATWNAAWAGSSPLDGNCIVTITDNWTGSPAFTTISGDLTGGHLRFIGDPDDTSVTVTISAGTTGTDLITALGGTIRTSYDHVDRVVEFDDYLIVHYGDTLAYDVGSGFVEYAGSYDHPDATHKMRRVEANKSFFFNTTEGVKKLDSIIEQPIQAGAPRGLGGTGSVTGSSGFMTNDTAVAYRVVWGYYDANNQLILGTPSQRLVVTNSSGGTRDVSLTFTIPDDVTTDWLYFIYRSTESASATDTPDDELQLVYEDNPTSAEITAQAISVTDTTLDELKGAALYTNQSQQTILQTNDRPPYCVDMCAYKDHIFYANTSTAHRYQLALISVGTGSPLTTDALTIGDTITIAGVEYTGAAAENAAAGEFLVDSSGTPSQNIDTTAISLIRVINTYASNTSVYAYYLSGFEDIPGKILIEERGIGGSSFAVNSSKSTCWSPRLPTVGSPIPDTSQSSDNEDKDNRIYISKRQQPEAVPLVNYIDVGNEHDPIDRIIALRDSVMVFKADGIFRITGTTYPFSVYPFNNSVEIRGLETAVVLDNRIFTMSDQGVVAIGDSGVEILSRNIERTLLAYTAEQFTNFNESFAVSYESERFYILFTVTNTSDETPTQAFVYNTITNAWTRWNISYAAGIVKESDDKLYLANTLKGCVCQERKSFTRDDYADEEYAFTITGAGSPAYGSPLAGSPLETSIYIYCDSTTNLDEGMTIEQGDTRAIIATIESATSFTIETATEFSPGAATAYVPIACAIEYTPQFAENPGITKQWREATFMFDDASFSSIDVTFRSNFYGGITYELTPLDAGLGQSTSWGNPTWGTSVWGGDQNTLAGANLIRTLVPAEAQRSHWLYIRLDLAQAFATFSFAGVSLQFNNVGSRMR